jgi:hypothetical protein
MFLGSLGLQVVVLETVSDPAIVVPVMTLAPRAIGFRGGPDHG